MIPSKGLNLQNYDVHLLSVAVLLQLYLVQFKRVSQPVTISFSVWMRTGGITFK